MTGTKEKLPVGKLILSAVAGALIWTMIGFSWFGYGFGWVTAGAVQTEVSSAVEARLTAICVAQAQADPDPSKLEAFAALSSYRQSTFVTEAGWSTMPDGSGGDRSLTQECAKALRSG